MAKVFVLMGYSGVGKDSLCAELQKLNKTAKNIKWSQPMKEMFEFAYGLSPGYLNDPVLRLNEVPDMPGVSYLDIMIRAFEYFPKIDPHMMTRKVFLDIEKALLSGFDVILTDTRNRAEEEVIKELSKSYEVILVWITRPGIKAQLSDQLQADILWEINNYCTEQFAVINDGDLTKLAFAAQEIFYDTH